MKRVQVGIVGSQFAASLHAEAYRRCPHADVVAVAAIDNLKVFCKEFEIPSSYDDYRQMFRRDDIDLISVCVPNFLHKEITLAAANEGKHVICEKPLATSLEDADEMVQFCASNRVKLMYGEDWIFAPTVIRTKSICEEGAIGDILYVKAKEAHSGSHSIYAQKLKLCGGGAMLHLAIHPIGFMRWFKGKEVVEVIGRASGGGSSNLLHSNFEGEDWAVAILTFEDGTFGLVEGNYVTLGGLDDQIEIYGSKGNIKVNLSQGSPIKVYSSHGYEYAIEKAETTKGWTTPAVDEESSLGYVDEIAHFVECVRLNKEVMPGVRGEDGRAALEIAMAIYKSIELEKTVKLPLSSGKESL